MHFLISLGIVSSLLLGWYWHVKKEEEKVKKIIVHFLKNSTYIKINTQIYHTIFRGWLNDTHYTIYWNRYKIQVEESYKYKKEITYPEVKKRYTLEDLFLKLTVYQGYKLIRKYERREKYMHDDLIIEDVEIENLRYTTDNSKEILIKDLISILS